MIVEEPSSPGHLDDHDIITSTSLNRSPERDVMEPKNISYVSASPEGSQYSRTARSMLEESDNEDEGDDLGDISRNPSLVDESFIQDDDGRDGEEFQGTIEDQPRKIISCEPFPMCQGDLPGLPVCQGSSLAEQIDMMTVSIASLRGVFACLSTWHLSHDRIFSMIAMSPIGPLFSIS